MTINGQVCWVVDSSFCSGGIAVERPRQYIRSAGLTEVFVRRLDQPCPAPGGIFKYYYEYEIRDLEGRWQSDPSWASRFRGFAMGYASTSDADCAFDCLNGDCVSAGTYKTPGIYETREDCNAAGCSVGCDGECADPEEIAALEQAASNIYSKLCNGDDKKWPGLTA